MGQQGSQTDLGRCQGAGLVRPESATLMPILANLYSVIANIIDIVPGAQVVIYVTEVIVSI